MCQRSVRSAKNVIQANTQTKGVQTDAAPAAIPCFVSSHAGHGLVPLLFVGDDYLRAQSTDDRQRAVCYRGFDSDGRLLVSVFDAPWSLVLTWFAVSCSRPVRVASELHPSHDFPGQVVPRPRRLSAERGPECRTKLQASVRCRPSEVTNSDRCVENSKGGSPSAGAGDKRKALGAPWAALVFLLSPRRDGDSLGFGALQGSLLFPPIMTPRCFTLHLHLSQFTHFLLSSQQVSQHARRWAALSPASEGPWLARDTLELRPASAA